MSHLRPPWAWGQWAGPRGALLAFASDLCGECPHLCDPTLIPCFFHQVLCLVIRVTYIVVGLMTPVPKRSSDTGTVLDYVLGLWPEENDLGAGLMHFLDLFPYALTILACYYMLHQWGSTTSPNGNIRWGQKSDGIRGRPLDDTALGKWGISRSATLAACLICAICDCNLLVLPLLLAPFWQMVVATQGRHGQSAPAHYWARIRIWCFTLMIIHYIHQFDCVDSFLLDTFGQRCKHVLGLRSIVLPPLWSVDAPPCD
jgi:hypothetical protein